jgi:hypothetical protein
MVDSVVPPWRLHDASHFFTQLRGELAASLPDPSLLPAYRVLERV